MANKKLIELLNEKKIMM